MSKPRLQMILSPAKTMNFSPCAVAAEAGESEAAGLARVNELAALLKTKSKGELQKILGVNDKIGAENYDRFAQWDDTDALQCIAAYDGFAYAKLQARTLSAEQLKTAQRRLLILSGMWGPVRPLDKIKPYRLEMACKALPEPYKKLAQYWQDLSTETLLGGFADGGDRVLVDIASGEYAAAIDFAAVKAQGVRVVKVEFHQGGKKAPTVHLKHGRGLVARYILLHDVDSLEALKGFDLEDYAYSAAASSDDAMVFARAAAPAKAPPKKKARKE